jgi:hypothetical protein
MGVAAWIGLAGGAAMGGNPQPPRPPDPVPSDAPAKTLKVTVLELETKQPVKQFTCAYTIIARHRLFGYHDLKTVRTKDGTFQIQVAPSCQIRFQVRAAGYVDEGWPGYQERRVFASQSAPSVRLYLKRGYAVRGAVLEAGTRRPIAGARVCPVVFTPPVFVADPARAVYTDEKGRFRLKGVSDLGIHAWHPRHFSAELTHGEFRESLGETDPDGYREVELSLESGPDIRGVVKDTAGRPIAGVDVSGGEKTAQTDARGRFVLYSPKREGWDEGRSYYLAFHKEGYLYQVERPRSVPSPGWTVMLEEEYEVAGRAMAPDGKPVQRFAIWLCRGDNPDRYDCERQQVADPQGRFSMRTWSDKPHWLLLRADGYATVQRRVVVKRGTAPMEIRLQRGVTLTGRVRPPGKRPSALRVSAGPDTRRMLRTLGAARADVAADGSFRLEHVAAGGQVLIVRGPGVTPLVKRVTVGRTDQDVGVLSPPGTGRIEGVVFREGGGNLPWPFAAGTLTHPDMAKRRGIVADERGRFTVEDVPAGRVELSFPFHYTADILGAQTATVEVRPGRTSRVVVGKGVPDDNF